MEWSEGGKWDNCNSIINKYIFKKQILVLLFSESTIGTFLFSESQLKKIFQNL